MIGSSAINHKSDDVYHLYDFSGNKFSLIEGENSYSIYDNDGIFIEGSLTNQSAYHEYLNDYELFYLGPQNYYARLKDSKLYDILNQQYVSLGDLDGAYYEIDKEDDGLISVASENDIELASMQQDSNGFYVLKHADYFRKLSQFPMNWYGECGLIALSMMLGYYDTFFNDDFIPNGKTYTARYYKTVDGKKVLDYTKEEPLIAYGKAPFQGMQGYDLRTWSLMPGTTYAMRDYLFDKYKHTFLGIGGDSGYPMMTNELKATMKDYLKDNCQYLLKDINFYNDNAITEENPTCYILASYKYESQKNQSVSGTGSTHIVLAYGRKINTFLCHIGWWPGSTKGAEMIISNVASGGFFSIDYNGEHKRSNNVIASSPNVYICGCGKYHF